MNWAAIASEGNPFYDFQVPNSDFNTDFNIDIDISYIHYQDGCNSRV